MRDGSQYVRVYYMHFWPAHFSIIGIKKTSLLVSLSLSIFHSCKYIYVSMTPSLYKPGRLVNILVMVVAILEAVTSLFLYWYIYIY